MDDENDIENNQEEMNEEQNINGEDPKENDEDNIINNDEEEQVVDQGEEQGEEQLEGQVEEEIVSPSNELNNQIVEQHDKNQQLEEEEDEANQQKLNQLKEEIENLTDSDIDDPKYKPYNNNPRNVTNDILKLQQKIIFLEKNNNFMLKSLKDYETENKILKQKLKYELFKRWIFFLVSGSPGVDGITIFYQIS